MNAGIVDAMRLASALHIALCGDPSALDAYGIERRSIAKGIVAFADVLTRLASVPPILRSARNVVLWALSSLPWFRRRLAWRLSGLIYGDYGDSEQRRRSQDLSVASSTC